MLDASWYAPEYEQALRNPVIRRQVIGAMEAGAATVQLDLANATVELEFPTSARELQGGKVVIVEVKFVISPKLSVAGIDPTTNTTACVSTDYGKTWKVAMSLRDVLKVYPKQ